MVIGTSVAMARGVKLASHWIRIGPWRVHARVALDQAPRGALPVVLVHGIGVSSRYLIPTGEQLARWYPVLVPDLPGFGASERPTRALTLTELAETLYAFVQAMDIHHAAFLGNSFGCQLIAELAMRHPAIVERAVLVGPTIDAAARTWSQQTLRLLADAVHEPLSLLPLVAEDYVRCGTRQIRATFEAALADSIESKLPHIQAPTLVVRGARDRIAPGRWVESLTRLLPYGWLYTIPGAAHAANYSHGRELAMVTQAFLAAPWAATATRTERSA